MKWSWFEPPLLKSWLLDWNKWKIMQLLWLMVIALILVNVVFGFLFLSANRNVKAEIAKAGYVSKKEHEFKAFSDEYTGAFLSLVNVCWTSRGLQSFSAPYYSFSESKAVPIHIFTLLQTRGLLLYFTNSYS